MYAKASNKERSHRQSGGAGLTGWSAVEDYMKDHDETMVKDYADDVDTLLVFAGLFSAVLTAFVIVSCALLQTDNSQTTVDLLTTIASQLNSYHVSSGYVNSSTPLPSTPLSQAFRPATSVIWVNCFWFISLVASLASAFFGILVKQWLREYMKWNATLGDPKENVLVRQIRHEAWTEWNVDMVIGTIPGLLELAVILFLAGLVILLWTVEPIVATVLTITIAIFLLTALFFLAAPVFFKRCPYKSPTARALVVATHICTALFNHARRSGIVFSPGRIIRNGAPSWKDTELQSIKIKQLMTSSGSLSNAATVYSHDLQQHMRGDSRSQCALLEMGKAASLLRALLWVARASQDEHVVANVAYSAESLHSTRLSYDIRYLSATHLLSTNIGASTFDSNDSLTSREVSKWLPLIPDYTLPKHDGTTATLIQILRLCYHMPETNRHRVRRVGGHLAATPGQGFGFLDVTWHSKSQWFCTKLHFDILLRLILGDIKCTIIELVRLAKSRPPSTEPISIGCRVMGLLCALHRLIRAAQARWPEHEFYRYEPVFGSLVEAYNILSTDAQADCIDGDWCPGLRTSIIATICTFANVQFNSDGKLEIADDHKSETTLSTSLALAKLIDSYDNSIQGRSYRREDCSCLVVITSIFLRGMDWQNIMPEDHWQNFVSHTVHSVVNRMISVAQTSLERSYSNCGSYERLPWLSTFTLRNFWLIAPGQLMQLLDTLEKANEQGLLTDEVKVQLTRAQSVVAYFNENLYNVDKDLATWPSEINFSDPLDISSSHFAPESTAL